MVDTSHIVHSNTRHRIWEQRDSVKVSTWSTVVVYTSKFANYNDDYDYYSYIYLFLTVLSLWSTILGGRLQGLGVQEGFRLSGRTNYLSWHFSMNRRLQLKKPMQTPRVQPLNLTL